MHSEGTVLHDAIELCWVVPTQIYLVILSLFWRMNPGHLVISGYLSKTESRS